MPELLGPEALRLQPFHLAATVLAGATLELKHPISMDATLVGLHIRIYRGAENSLHLIPYIERANGIRRPLVQFTPGGKQYIDGDDDNLTWLLSEPVSATDETLCVTAINTDMVNAHSFFMDVSKDLANGKYPGVSAGGR